MFTAPPIEIYEAVIDCVWIDCKDRRVRRRTLLACALTCKSWLIRSRRYLFREISLRSSAQLHNFWELLRKVDIIHDYVKEVEITDTQVLLSFATVLARRLTGVESLVITHRHAQLYAMIQSLTFAPLPYFVAMSSLQVQHVVFANFTDFERLLCALPRLSHLSCIDVMWNAGGHNPLISSRKAPCLRSLELELCPLQQIMSWIIAVNSTYTLERIILPFVNAEELEWVGQLLAHTQATLQHLTLACHDANPNSTSLMRAVDTHLNLGLNKSLKSIRFSLFRAQNWNWIEAMLRQVTPDAVISEVIFDVHSFVSISGALDSSSPPRIAHAQCTALDQVLARKQLASARIVFMHGVPDSEQDSAAAVLIRSDIPLFFPLSHARAPATFITYRDREDRYRPLD